jgi:hypothetical protein
LGKKNLQTQTPALWLLFLQKLQSITRTKLCVYVPCCFLLETKMLIDVKKKRKDKKAEQAKRYDTDAEVEAETKPRRSRPHRSRPPKPRPQGRDHQGRGRMAETTKAEAALPLGHDEAFVASFVA